MTDTAVDNNKYPKISIIIATLNVAKTLQTCLDSIFKLAYPAIEIVIMDGSSTDNTIDILKQNDKKISFWKSEPDEGIYYAMNKALEHITGQWVYFMGADDELLADFSELAFQLKDNSIIYYANVIFKGVKYRGPVTSYIHAKGTICHQAMIYPVQVFDKYRFSIKYRISADHELNMRCWKDKNFTFRYIDLIIANYSSKGISSLNIDYDFEKDKAKLIFKNHGFINWVRYSFRQLKERIFPKKKR
jgi:glycosyltransferase involved in cell wall biosynthesis